MTKKIFEVITGFLDQRIGGVSELIQHNVEGKNVVEGPDVKNVITAAVKHAIADFTSATGDAFNGEEHRTSAFMGHLGSCIGWYNLFSHLSSGNQTSIRWNTQKRQSTSKVDGEDITGADFGVAIALSNGNYNLAMFQAKNAERDSGIEFFDINRVPSGYSAKLDKIEPKNGTVDKSFLTEKGLAADNRFKGWIASGTIAPLNRRERIVEGAIVVNAEAKSQKKVIDHQIIKMAQQNDFAFTGCEVPRKDDEVLNNWTHYVIWRDEHSESFAPAVVSLDVVRAALQAKIESTPPIKRSGYFSVSGILSGLAHINFYLPGNESDDTPSDKTSGKQDEKPARVLGLPFADFLISGVNVGAKGWLEVDETQIKILVAELSELGVNWSIAGRSGGGTQPMADPATWLPDAAPEPMSGLMAETASTQVGKDFSVEVHELTLDAKVATQKVGTTRKFP